MTHTHTQMRRHQAGEGPGARVSLLGLNLSEARKWSQKLYKNGDDEKVKIIGYILIKLEMTWGWMTLLPKVGKHWIRDPVIRHKEGFMTFLIIAGG